jgi:putative ABC transport system permease protein
LARPRFRAALIAGFAFLGAALALVGIYGVMALVVAGRRREIGVRLALGAERGAVRSEVVGQALRIAGAGLALGLIGASALGRTTESFLFGVRPFDPMTYGAVLLTVVAGVALAVLPTARRAASVDPLEVLHAE